MLLVIRSNIDLHVKPARRVIYRSAPGSSAGRRLRLHRHQLRRCAQPAFLL